MTRAIRDIEKFNNNLIATVKAAGASGMPLMEALKKVAGRDPLGCDYAAANNLRKAGILGCSKNLPKNAMTVYYLNNGQAPAPNAEIVPPKPRKVRRHHKASAKVGVLLTLQYGKGESVTLSFDEARQLYEQLATMFAG